MRARACLSCFLLFLLAMSCVSALPARAQGTVNTEPALGADEEEDAGNDGAEREEAAPTAAAGGDRNLGLVRRADGDELDWDEDSRPRPPHPAQLAHPDYDVVVCEAGCDGEPGSIVYLQKRERRTE
jgi:hypothetical protein